MDEYVANISKENHVAKLRIQVFEKGLNEETDIKIPLSFIKVIGRWIPIRFVPVLHRYDAELKKQLEEDDCTPRTLVEAEDSEDRIVISIV